MIGKTISHYKIIGKIGEGGRGVVYKAEDINLQRTVALKFISPHLADNKEDLRALYSEAQSASKLNHPNITTIYEIGHSGKHHFIAMEYLGGVTLKEKIKQESFDLSRILDLSIPMLEGIKAAHEKNIVHRDIKSENVMLAGSGAIKVMDFGLARSLERDNVTKVSVTLGTVAYMSPEQIEGSKVDQRSDIYSFGVVLYEMLTGRLPFVGEHEAATLYSIVNEPPPNILEIEPNADKHLVAIIEKTLEKEPEHRYQNASELLNDLQELKGGTFQQKFIKSDSKSIRNNKFLSGKWLAISIAILIAISTLIFTGILDTSPQLVKSLAVLNFENMSKPQDSERLGQILQELIIADLSDIEDLKVFSSQRLFDIQKQLGSDNRNSIDPDLATDIARRAGAEALLTGKIIQNETKLILTSQLINISDGSIIKSHQVEGSDIYVMVDNLTELIQADLRIPIEDGESVTYAVADKTTSSVNAFQFYFAGVDYFNQSHFDEAIAEFNRAVEIDSTFSSAYYKLAMAQWWSQSESNNETIENAQESLQKILNGQWYKTTKEKLLAQGAMELTKQNFKKAEEIYKQLIDFIDDEKEAWYGLGEAYFHGPQDFEGAAEAFERAIELDPEFTVAYRHIFDIYAMNKEYDSGIIRATQLIDNDLDGVWGYIFLSQMLVGKKEYERAKPVLEDAVRIDDQLPIIYSLCGKVFIELGQFDEGIEFINSLSTINNLPEKYELLSRMHVGKQEFGTAINILENAIKMFPDDYGILLSIGRLYQLSGNYQLALKHSEEFEKNYPYLWKNVGRYALINIYNELGMYTSTINVFQDMLGELSESDSTKQADIKNNLAYHAYLAGNSDQAKQYIDEALAVTTSLKEGLVSYLIQSLIFSKNNDLAGLLNLTNIVEDSLLTDEEDDFHIIINQAVQFNYYYTSRDYELAIEKFEEMDPDDQITQRFYYSAGIAYYELGDYEKVIDLVDKMSNSFLPSNLRAYLYPRSFLLKGLVNEAQDNMTAAKSNYNNLLDIWQDGDRAALDYQIVLQRYNSI